MLKPLATTALGLRQLIEPVEDRTLRVHKLLSAKAQQRDNRFFPGPWAASLKNEKNDFFSSNMPFLLSVYPGRVTNDSLARPFPTVLTAPGR